jgi:hypothetical protein
MENLLILREGQTPYPSQPEPDLAVIHERARQSSSPRRRGSWPELESLMQERPPGEAVASRLSSIGAESLRR